MLLNMTPNKAIHIKATQACVQIRTYALSASGVIRTLRHEALATVAWGLLSSLQQCYRDVCFKKPHALAKRPGEPTVGISKSLES
jgi:hypothetical protein